MTANELNIRETDRRIRGILIPVILENALMTLSSMILTGYIGRLTVAEMNVYGITNRMYGIYNSLFKGLAVGAMLLMAREFGRKNSDRAGTLLREAYSAFFPIGIVLAAVILLSGRTLLSTMTPDTDLLSEGAYFLRFTAPFFPLLAVIHLNTSAFQAKGDTRTPMMIAMLGNAINIVLGYFLIFTLKMGIYGAAWAQNTSFAAMMITGCFLLFVRRKRLFEPSSYDPSHKKEDLRQIFSGGLPAAAEFSMWNLAAVVISRVILSYGQPFYAAYQIGLQAEGFCDMMSAGFLTAAMSLASNAVGAEDDALYRLYYRRLCFFCYVISGITMAFLLLFSRNVTALMTDKPQLIDIAGTYLFIMIFSQFPQHMQKILFGFIRSSGHVRIPMVINFIGLWVVRVSLVWLFGTVLKLDIIWIWHAINIDQWTRCTLAFLLSRRLHVMDAVHAS